MKICCDSVRYTLLAIVIITIYASVSVATYANDESLTREVGFVPRLKVNADCCITARREVPQNRNILSDETIEFNVFAAGRTVKGSYRRVRIWLKDKQEELVLLTNRHDLGATTIAAIYKQRWQIELSLRPSSKTSG